jgi:spermidine synthase
MEKPLLWFCFTLSGAAALGLELLWLRSASLVVGATSETAASVLASFFAGLALGGMFGRDAPVRPIRRYATLELAAAVAVLWSYAVFSIGVSDSAELLLSRGGTTARVALISLAIVPTTFFLGATLPALGQALATPATVGSRGGILYALNTLGGVVGIAAMGFGLPGWIGVRASYLMTAATVAFAGILALGIRDEELHATPAPARRPVNSPLRLRSIAAGTGFLGIAIEVLWVRLFAQVLHNSVYSFAAVSLVFLLAIAAGAAIGSASLRRVAPPGLAATSLVLAGLTAVLGVWCFIRWTVGLRYFGMETGLAEYVARIVGLAAASAGPAAIASGAVLPALWAAESDRYSVARPIGELTAANLAGAVFGAPLTAFVAIPAIGIRATFLLAAVAYVALADAVPGSPRTLRPLGYVALLMIAALDPLRAPLTHLRSGETLRASAEGPSGIVTVVDTGDDLQLRFDNYYVLGGSAVERSERRQGLIPLLLHPAPRRVAFIGMATGITASAAPALGVSETTVIELVPEVASMAGAHFARWNGRLLHRDDVRLVVDDGRHYLRASASRFDVIVSDLYIPWHANAGSLYSREMFAAAAHHLAPRGLFCQWLPLYQLSREEFEVIARTLLSVFPHVSLWRNDFYPDRPVVGLVGSLEIVPLDLERVGERIAALPDWARDSLLSPLPRSLPMLYIGNLSEGAALFPTGPVNTDDRPVIEFLAPRLTRMNAQSDKDWFTGEAFAEFADALFERLSAAPDHLVPLSGAVTDAQRAGFALYRYALAARRGDRASADHFESEVRRLVPEVVAAGDQETSVPALTDVRRMLEDLKSEQERLRRELESVEKRLGRRSAGASP